MLKQILAWRDLAHKMLADYPPGIWPRLARDLILSLRPRKPAPILAPYVNVQDGRGKLFNIFLLPVLGIFCVVYGFYFALMAPYQVIAFLIPILLLTIFAIWALPDQRTTPFSPVRFCLAALIVCLILWPNYLAVALPGLPWITMMRLFGIPMALLVLVCLSVSPSFRNDLGETLGATPIIWKSFVALIVMQFVTVPLSDAPFDSFNKTIIFQVLWTSVFVASVYTFRKPGRIPKYLSLLTLLAIPIIILTQLEFDAQRVLWQNHVPNFLKIDEAAGYVVAEFRAGINVYRAKATFSTALGLAEYLSLVTAFFLHFVASSRRFLIRLASLVAIGAIYYAIELSGSRLGVIGMLVSLLTYVLIWAFARWKRSRDDLIAPSVLAGYPFAVLTFIGLSFVSNRLGDAIWGGGEAKSSNEARLRQIDMALPQLIKNPIGHGTGMSGDSLGYGAGQFVTVDNYYITIAMDYGVIGLVAHFLMFYAAILYACWYAVFYASKSKDPDAQYLIPLAVSLTAFVVIKLVFSQPDNHPMAYMMLGMVVALIYRLKREFGELKPKPAKLGRVGLVPQARGPLLPGLTRQGH